MKNDKWLFFSNDDGIWDRSKRPINFGIIVAHQPQPANKEVNFFKYI